MTAPTLPRHYAPDELPEPLTPTAQELEEIAWVWRSACGDVLSPADWSALSAVGAD